ncbi:MAG: uroporphyrinogen decarboxylase family protein [Saccharofermentanales bacterium]
MNSRERFLAAINGKIPDRVPTVTNLTAQLAEKLAAELGCDVQMEDSFLATRISHRDILLKLGNDAVLVAATRAAAHPTVSLPDGNVRDEWGLVYEQVGLYSEAVVRPLAGCTSVEDLDRYVFPDPLDDGRWAFAEEVIPRYIKEYGIIGDLEACIYELAWNLVGMEKFIMDMATEEEYITVLLDRIAEYSTLCGLKMIDLGVDMIWTGDDFGTQKGMMISPDMWRENFRPRMKKMFDTFKQRNPAIKIAYHSCGCIVPIIPELIEIGLDILNPLQPMAAGMELSGLYREYSDKLVFFGGVDVQGVLPNGTVQDVENEVIRCIRATDGGKKLIIAPAHNLQPDTPIENVYAFFDAVKKYGTIE